MNKYFTLIIFTLLFFSSETHSQWYLQYQSPTFAGFYDVRFLNRDTGWSCGEGMILKTINGGKSWVVQEVPYTLMQIHPVNDSVVYTCGFRIILKTTNAGNNWITLLQGTDGPDFYGLWFNDENTGWFGGDRVAMRTTNGGQSFIDSMYINSELHDIHFKNDSVGNAAAYARMFRTTNAGINWYPVTLPTNWESPFTDRITFIGDTGWTASWGSTVFKTTNYGISWDSITRIPFTSSDLTYCIEFSSQSVGYAGGHRGIIFKTTDGGYNWNLSCQIGVGVFKSIYSYNDSVIWGVGPGIRNTTNGGGLLVKVNESFLNNIKQFELFQNYPNPFNSSTVIMFRVQNNSFVKLGVFDLSGKKIESIVNNEIKPGEYTKKFESKNLSSGVYFYTIKILEKNSGVTFQETKKLLIIK